MRAISGIGEVKLRDFAGHFLPLIATHCQQHGLAMDQGDAPPPPREPRTPGTRMTARLIIAFELFRKGTVIDDVMHQMGLSRSTITDYLNDFIRQERPASIAPWVSDAMYQRVAAAARQTGTARLKPIYLMLGEAVDYDVIRLVVTHMTATSGEG
jgi:hypothetical protein